MAYFPHTHVQSGGGCLTEPLFWVIPVLILCCLGFYFDPILELKQKGQDGPTTVEITSVTWQCQVIYNNGLFNGGTGTLTKSGNKNDAITCPEPKSGVIKSTTVTYYYDWKAQAFGTKGTYQLLDKDEWQAMDVGEKRTGTMCPAIIVADGPDAWCFNK